MTVYVVMHVDADYADYQILGVYSSEEKAINAILPFNDMPDSPIELGDVFIDEIVLDDEISFL